MNPLSALPASPDAGAVPARNAATGTNAAETTDFSTILAGQAMPDATANVGP
ncbi:MAG: hypothetical protein JSR28_00555, partial [Proteobacteria bacterium]|nr:hypothetical protein [Pseudomonadota bacterium]